MRRHKLLAAQPSNCRGADSDNPYWVHWQLPGLELHYVNVVEVTAPGLAMPFLDGPVRPLLEHTFSGAGPPRAMGACLGRGGAAAGQALRAGRWGAGPVRARQRPPCPPHDSRPTAPLNLQAGACLSASPRRQAFLATAWRRSTQCA